MLLHPLMLAWLGGAAIPLVLHLLSRSMYRPVPWGAMMFLTGVEAGPQRAAHLKQWTLLLLRMVLVGLLVVALARPVIASRYAWVPTAGLTTGGPASIVIILDDSASMGYQRDGKSRLDEARQQTLQILSSLKRGDEAALLLAGYRQYQPPLPPNADLQSIAGRVVDLQPDTGQANFAVDILRATDLLDHATSNDRQIYLICDRQASNWRDMTDGFKKQWSSRKNTGPLPRLTVIPVGGDESDNVAVDRIEFPDRAIVRNQPTTALVQVHNYGPLPLASVPLSVWSGARSIADTTVSVPAHATRAVSVPIRFTDQASRVISAAVHSTGLTTDDRMDASVDVLDLPRILIVDRAALPATTSPVDDGADVIAHGNYGGQITIKTSQQLNTDLLKQQSIVILNDVAQFSADQVTNLKNFARAGGGVVFLPGSAVTADQCNSALFADNGIFPAKVTLPAGKPVHVGPIDRQHPILRTIADALTTMPIGRYLAVASHAPDKRTLVRYNNNQPLLLEAPLDLGHVLFVTASLDYHSPPAKALLQSMIRYLATASGLDRNLNVGQPIIAVTYDPVEDRSATVQFLSGGQREPATINRQSDRTEIRYQRTNQPGIYRLRYRTTGKEKVLNYVVTAGHSDSDLTPLTAEQWRDLADRIRFDRVDLSRTTVAQAMDVQRGGREIWIELIGGVLILMTLEMLLSKWWSVG